MKVIAKLSRNFTGFLTSTSRESKTHVSFSHSLFCMSTSACSQPLSTVSVTDFLVHKHNFSPEVASQAATVYTRLKNPENADSMLSFLKESGFSVTQLEKIVKYRPRFLSANLEASIKPKIKMFQELGLSSEDIAKIISGNPAILHISLNGNIIPSLSVLNRLFGSNYDLSKHLKICRWSVTANLDRTLVPNVEFLKNCGIPMERILKILSNYPMCLLMKPEIIRKSVEKAEEMGVNRSSRMFVYAVRIIASTRKETWELKLQAFRTLGFSDSDILTMFRKAPYIIGFSVEKVKKMKELLLGTGKFNLSNIIDNPTTLSCSIEKRYEPRFRVLGILESKNLIKCWPSLATIQTLKDDEFCEKFVSPYLHELGDALFPTNSIKEKKTSTECWVGLVIEQSTSDG